MCKIAEWHDRRAALLQGMVMAALVGGAALLAVYLARKLLVKNKPHSGRAEHSERTASRKRTDRPGCAASP